MMDFFFFDTKIITVNHCFSPRDGGLKNFMQLRDRGRERERERRAARFTMAKRRKHRKRPRMDARMNKMQYIDTAEDDSAFKRESSDKCYDMGEPRKHDARYNGPVTKGQILCDSTYMRYRK